MVLKCLQQKVVIKVSMNGSKSRSKAMKIAVGVSGVETAAIQGENKDQIAVTGEGIDSVCLTSLLRKSFCHAELVSVGPVAVEEKKKEGITLPIVWPYVSGVPQCPVYEIRHPSQYQDPSCSIM
ncbi:heavy metal-associated isoprenylated plant protein 47-like [Gastrolobium bilobum]|uniref:heavy metal-associated isoprenylated plant protein 47-like n=1 Tax=Gastrolobium bilobum TaxID=150636 RepID=UPI002AB119F9|nr:heavy metal-associated isoprenylated plant protein 47-like [Gastrolobium bilobum]